MKKSQNTYFYIWIPASQPSHQWTLRHVRLLSKNKRSCNDPNKRDLYTCCVWAESVNPVADLRPTNQLLYQTVQSDTAE